MLKRVGSNATLEWFTTPSSSVANSGVYAINGADHDLHSDIPHDPAAYEIQKQGAVTTAWPARN